TPPKNPLPPAKTEELTLEKLFPTDGLFGQQASGMAFAHDGKYAAYLHRPSKERKHGPDLWLLDVAAGKTARVTSKEKMARFQASARKADDKTNRYSGVSTFTWSPAGAELLFTSEGDIYRWKVGEPAFSRLTMTRSAETLVRYLTDGKGYTCLRDNALMRVVFGSEMVEQIDPKLPAGETLSSYRFSPDGKFLAFTARKAPPQTGAERKVAIANYRDRFMKVHEVPRQVSDDPVPAVEVKVYLYRLNEPMLEDGEPSLIFQHKVGGPRDLLTSLDWSPDSK